MEAAPPTEVPYGVLLVLLLVLGDDGLARVHQAAAAFEAVEQGLPGACVYGGRGGLAADRAERELRLRQDSASCGH
ncbi:hypothetical protein TSOC_004904 [Tetrabaena socialis]|uniref:Uncharacterized protein n=1 Tax=Tetrabaena socialis TaxID=47790 RepID=A0A2J8A7T6_9CHLO|nr:hypothetical protein TSOC_004904 [Tetrabaena socialis]|eukprot:PNH08533.1 hypothetical protein TSOC_004904 [Tetrabaena socialis]